MAVLCIVKCFSFTLVLYQYAAQVVMTKHVSIYWQMPLKEKKSHTPTHTENHWIKEALHAEMKIQIGGKALFH